MISDEEKAKIKDDIVNKVNSVLEKNTKTKQLNSWEIIEFMTEKITMLFQERLIIS